MDILNDLSNFDLGFLMQDPSTVDYTVSAEDKENAVQIKRKILEHMQGKYEIEFTDENPLARTVVFPFTELLLWLKTPGQPRWSVRASYQATEDGEEVFKDNYMAYALRDELKELLRPELQNIFGTSCKLLMGLPGMYLLDDKIGLHTTVEEYAGCAVIQLRIFTDNDPARWDVDHAKLLASLLKKGTNGTFAVIYVTPETLTKIDESRYLAYRNIPLRRQEQISTLPQNNPFKGIDFSQLYPPKKASTENQEP